MWKACRWRRRYHHFLLAFDVIIVDTTEKAPVVRWVLALVVLSLSCIGLASGTTIVIRWDLLIVI